MKRNVFLLGLVSLFTDLSSQMIYPLIPQFLVDLGANKSVIGMIEGLADATASLFKAVFGRWSDRLGKRKWFVFAGYGLATIAKPFLYVASIWSHVLAVRFADRLGKAARNPARDALIAASVPPQDKGKAFGMHRSMDRIGAFGGPILALIILHFSPENVRLVFLLAVIPALLALGFIPFVKGFSPAPQPRDSQGSSKPALTTSPLANRTFLWFLIVNLVFALGNSSNAFLLLKASETGIAILWLPILWMLYNAVSAIASPIFGSLSDKLGRQGIILMSFLVYALIYLGFAVADQSWHIWTLFGMYGIYYGLSNGVYRAYISDLIPHQQLGSAYGVYTSGIGIVLFPASLMAGVIWDAYGSYWTFVISASLAIMALALFWMTNRKFSQQT
ncbi:MAG: MFS transporter [Bacteroidota bacterium]